MATIIYIHGRGLKPAADCERSNWLRALNRGLGRLGSPTLQIPDDARFQLAYWSDLFYPNTTPAPCVPDGAGASAITPPQDAGLQASIRAVQAYVDQFWNNQRRIPDASRDQSTRSFEDGFVRDVIKFFGLGYGSTCVQPLVDRLVAADEQVMLVSHSFGTVLAYEVLANQLEDINTARATPLTIDTWVTMGSPLGWAIDLQANIPQWQELLLAQIDDRVRQDLAGVQQTIVSIGDALLRKAAGAPATGVAQPLPRPLAVRLPPKTFPSGVGRWFNIYDRRDPVACEGGVGGGASLPVSQTFLYKDPTQGPVQRAFDNEIRNDACPESVHGVSMDAHDDFQGYGQCAQLAQVAADFWNRCAVA
jgi:hypothetical protein